MTLLCLEIPHKRWEKEKIFILNIKLKANLNSIMPSKKQHTKMRDVWQVIVGPLPYGILLLCYALLLFSRNLYSYTAKAPITVTPSETHVHLLYHYEAACTLPIWL
jgi:hypothetical protein